MNIDWSKFSSGKFWLTIITGLVFAYCAVRHILGSEAISTICGMVFISYFQKQDTKNGGGGGGEKKVDNITKP